MKLIVGLGNPGERYAQTRHNAGFWVVDALARRWNIALNSKNFQSIFGTGRCGEERIVLAKPQTFMNLSGLAVRQLIGFWQAGLEDLLVIHDDLDLAAYRIRLKRGGGAAAIGEWPASFRLCGPSSSPVSKSASAGLRNQCQWRTLSCPRSRRRKQMLIRQWWNAAPRRWRFGYAQVLSRP